MKYILLTGASRGLGLDICKELLSSGYGVLAVSRTKSEEIVSLEKKHPGQLMFKAFDLSKSNAVETELLDKTWKFELPIYGFVNNAAMAYDDIISNLNVDRLKTMYDTNVFSPMVITKYVIRNMLLHNIKGSIVHISSISVHTGYKGLSMYASTKGALEAFSKNCAREWGERGIRSNCLVAGFMETDMSSNLKSEQKDRIYKRTCLKQPTETTSVAAMVSFLLSTAATSVTGQNMFVDSGTI